MISNTRSAIAIIIFSAKLLAEDGEGRVFPPGVVDCPRDHLTAYSGKVVGYWRTEEKLSLSIETDWGTLERVDVVAHGPERLEQRNLISGKSFTRSDWHLIETADGNLRDGVRATAWVCDDDRPPLIDWKLLNNLRRQ